MSELGGGEASDHDDDPDDDGQFYGFQMNPEDLKSPITAPGGFAEGEDNAEAPDAGLTPLDGYELEPDTPDGATEQVDPAFMKTLLDRLREHRQTGREIRQGEFPETQLTPAEAGWTTQTSWLSERFSALFSQAAAETLWRCAEITANYLHFGAGHLIVWAYRAAHIIAAARGINSGEGFDFTIDYPYSPVKHLAVAFSIREMQDQDGPTSKPQLLLDVSFTDFSKIGGVDINVDGPGGGHPEESALRPADGMDPWIEWFGNADPEMIRRHIVAASPMITLADMTNDEWYANALALKITLDRDGRPDPSMNRGHWWQRPRRDR